MSKPLGLQSRRAAIWIAARPVQKQGLPPPLKAGSVKQFKATIFRHSRHNLSIGKAPSPVGQEALRRIGQLYDIERQIHGRLPEDRFKARQERTKPLLDALEKWMQDQLGKLSRKSAAVMAIRYALGRWTALTQYCRNGLVEIDNNPAERALRAVAIGRRRFTH